MWSQQVKFTLPGTYANTWVFPSVRVVLGVTFIPGLLCLWTNDFKLKVDPQLFPSLYLERDFQISKHHLLSQGEN